MKQLHYYQIKITEKPGALTITGYHNFRAKTKENAIKQIKKYEKENKDNIILIHWETLELNELLKNY